MERTGDLGGAWDWDLRTGTGSWTLDTARLFGINRPASPVTLETWQACLHRGDRGRAADRLIEALVTQASYQDEFRIVAFDDRVRWLRSLGAIIPGTAGRPTRMVGFTTDITRQRDRSQPDRPDRVGASEMLEMIRRGARFRNHLVSDVLDTGAVLMGRLTIKPSPKFTPIGGRVWVRVSTTSRAARLEVADTGRGFEPGGPSPGLGLAIVGHLVGLHGGVVSATSLGKGHGATFVVDLPLMLPSPGMR